MSNVADGGPQGERPAVPIAARRQLDYDAFRRERTAEPLEVKVGGVVYLLPPTMPAATAIDVIEWMHRQNAAKEAGEPEPQPTPDMLFTMAEPLFGKGVLRKIAVEHELDVDELGDLITLVFELYNADVPVPNRASRRHPAKPRRAASSG